MKKLKLVVKSPFRSYKKGDQILDDAEIAVILSTPHEKKMVTRAFKTGREK